MSFLKEYTMLKELGKGGFATVYKVRHDELGYIRAIRVLNDTISNENSETYKKFLEECKLLLRLGNGTHPNIVHIYQPRLLDNKAVVEMDFVEGSDLNKYLKAQNYFVPINDVLRFANEISSALAYCHEDIFQFCMDMDYDNLQSDPNDGEKVLLDKSTIHRLIEKYKVIHNDIHSGNIIRKYDGSFILLDFGLAIIEGNAQRSSRRRGGAPEFKAPEKWNNENALSEQIDMYSLGIVMYEMLAGQVPFPFDKKLSNQTEAEYNLSKQHQTAPPPPILPLRKAAYESANPGKTYEKDYPQWLEEVILKCLEKKPEDRFANGKELHEYVKQQMKQTFLSNNEEYRTIKEENERLTHDLSKLSDENSQLELHINALAKQFGAASSELEKIKSKADKLEQENEKLKSEKKEISVLQAKLRDAEKRLQEGNCERAQIASTTPKANYLKGIAFYKRKDYTQAVPLLRKAAEQGNADAQYFLGFCYYNGQGVSQDYNQAVIWYRKAVERGKSLAQNNLGECYYNGEGVSKDYKQAVSLYKKAAEQGHAKAQNSLGNCYYNGEGVSKDYKQAVSWYRKATEQGHAEAQYNLGECYYYGDGVTQDYKQAVSLYKKAAEQGEVSAQYNLGACYYYGDGVTKDNTQTKYWWRKAAEQGNVHAKTNLKEKFGE